MRTKNPFWWFSAAALGLTFATAGFIAFLFWNQLALDEKAIFLEIIQGRFIYFFGAGFVLFLGFGLILDGIFHLYILPIKRLNEELQVMQSVHPGHRIKGKGEGWFGDISRRLNTWADRTETMQKEVEKQIGLARAEIEEERNIFAAILSELPQGVLICNAEGRILLYDQQSRAYLETEPLASNGADLSKGAGHFIGLGRSIFGVMDKYRLVHALDEIALKLERKDPGVSSRFIMVGPKGNLLQVEVVPVLDPCDRLCTGFALILEDITKRMAEEAKIDGLLQELTTGIRTSVAAIRSAAEAMIAYPEMESAKRNRFQEIILEESLAIGQRVNLTASDYPSRLFGRWPLVRTTASDFAEAVRRQAQSKLGIAVEIHGESRKEWIGLDSYSALLAMLFLLNRLKPRAQPPVFTMELEKEETFICLDLHWNGEGVSMETLRTWDAEILSVGGEAIPLPLGEIIRHHGAEIFPLKGRKGRKRHPCGS